MTEARGIHAHPTLKLGRRSPSLRRSVAFGAFLKAAPAHPIADPPPNLNYPMDKNDVAGDCVVAGLDHALQTISAALGVQRSNWTDAQILAYYQTQNPGFKSWADGGGANDGGMDIQTFLEYLVAHKVILAFGRIDHTSEDEMKAAVYLGVAIVTGEDLEVAQQTQTVWDYKASNEWGGHCTCTVGYSGSPDRQACVTWGGVTEMTQAFISRQLSEAWFVLTQAHVDHPAFRAGFDVAAFSAAISELTGGKVVVPVPAPQPPQPAPAPAPGPAPVPAPANIPADWVTWARHTLTLKSESHATLAVAREIIAAAGQ